MTTGSRAKLAAYIAFSWVPHTIAYVIAPLLVCRIGNRVGLRQAAFTPAHWLGAPALLLGTGVIAWAIVSHYQASSDRMELTSDPDYLAHEGAYGRTRNPLYLGGTLLWAGWAAVLASPDVALGGALLFGFFATIGVLFEERRLSRKFGASYDDYRRRVPRWIGRRRDRYQ